MNLRRHGYLVTGLFLASMGLSSIVRASPNLVLDGEEISLTGKHHFRIVNLSNGARLIVPPYEGDPEKGGRLEILAHYILIDSTSSIDATASGYRGISDADGEGEGGGKGAAVSSDATGGGGHGAAGGNGVLTNGCIAIDGAVGGPISIAPGMDVAMGSAGSAAGTAGGMDGGRGARGGGAVLLRAGRIELDGKILANGETGGVFHDNSAGGGAGGGILIQASHWLGFGGHLEANGGPGGLSSKCQGGGGGGGFLRLLVQDIPPGITLSQTGGQASCPKAAGQNTDLQPVVNPGCLDLDGDGFQSDQCGGTDCDDSDPTVKKGGVEICNGQDDDCNGLIDDGDLCPGGTCIEGICVDADAGTDAAADVHENEDALVESDAPEDTAKEMDAPLNKDAEIELDGSPEDSNTQPNDASEDDARHDGLGEVIWRGGCHTHRAKNNPSSTVFTLLILLMASSIARFRNSSSLVPTIDG